MPLTDLPVAGQMIAAFFGFVIMLFVLPAGFFDTFLHYYQARHFNNLE